MPMLRGNRLQKAEQAIIQSKYDKEYLPITGFAEFTKQAALLAYGKDSAPLKEGRVSARPVDPLRSIKSLY